MKYIVLDTETSGLMDYKRPADAEGQPRVAEVALIYLNDDFKVEREYQAYIQPDGWVMDPGATAIHKLTDEFLREHGVPMAMPLAVYTQAIAEGRSVLAYGAQYDCKMMRAEFRRAGIPDLFEETKSLCIMRNLMSHAKQTGRRLIKYDADGNPLPTAKGWPKLTDACRYYNIPIPEKTHGALEDARLAQLVFAGMIAEGFDREASVHYSKDYEAIRDAK